MEIEVLETKEKCRCGGEIDRRQLIQREPPIWNGACFQCGRKYTVIENKENGGKVKCLNL